MRRRDLMAALLVSATIGRVQAQQTGKVYHIAMVEAFLPVAEMSETAHHPGVAGAYRVFFDELRRLGYVEGQNLVVERYSGEGRPEQFRALAAVVVRSNPDLVYVINGGALQLAFKAETKSIPIVLLTADPIALGAVSSLARPGGNITGISVDAGIEIWSKRLDLLREAVPKLSRLGFLVTPWAWGSKGAAVLREASEKRGISLVGSPLDSPIAEAAYRRAFAAMAQEGADAVFVGDEGEHSQNLPLIVELAETGRLPAIYPWHGVVEIGALMAYAFDGLDMIRRVPGVIDQILRGTKPGDIPFYQASKFELDINLKTAKTLGLSIPDSLLARADKVIE
jgi:putative ABC transport system substrate-binding protein